MSSERSVKDLSGPYTMEVARPRGLELPTFWFVGGFHATRQHTHDNKSQSNQREERKVLGWSWLVLYTVHG
jgi:hypothetical protein